MSQEKPNSRISILSKVVTESGKYDDEKCRNLLGEYYDNFIALCDHITYMPLSSVESVGLVELKPETKKAMFKVKTKDGTYIEIET